MLMGQFWGREGVKLVVYFLFCFVFCICIWRSIDLSVRACEFGTG